MGGPITHGGTSPMGRAITHGATLKPMGHLITHGATLKPMGRPITHGATHNPWGNPWVSTYRFFIDILVGRTQGTQKTHGYPWVNPWGYYGFSEIASKSISRLAGVCDTRDLQSGLANQKPSCKLQWARE